jgi:hypothetical protein
MKPIFSRVTAYLAEALVRDYLEPGDYLCLIGFSDAPHVRVSQRIAVPAEKENLVGIVGRLNVVPQGFTDMGRALEEAGRQLDRLADPSHEQAILILTDGLNQPPRDSPYFDPVRPDTGSGLPPTSGFNARFLDQVQRLAGKGWRIHVVGIGTDTDARKLADALGAGHTIVRDFNGDELRAGLARFWDDALNLAGIDQPQRSCAPGEALPARVRIRSASDQDREIRLRGARVAGVTSAVTSTGIDAPPLTVALASLRWPVAARREAAFDLSLALPNGFPAGDYRATVVFDQESAIKFYPPRVDLSFHVSSFWERQGTKVLAVSAGIVLAALVVVRHRRRPIPVALAADGEAEAAGKPVPFRIATACSVGGGAADRFRVPGLPAKVAVLERRGVDRFALLSSRPELLPTVPEYTLGDPVEVRPSTGAAERRVIRFVRWHRRARARSRTPVHRAPPPAGSVDFR